MDTRQRNIGAATDGDAGADYLTKTAFAFWRATLLLNAEEIGFFAALARGLADAAALRVRFGLDEETVTDLLDALVAVGLVERCDGVYRNTAAAARFLDPTLSSYIGGRLDIARAAQRETTAAMDRLRETTRRGWDGTALTGRMWEEVGAIVSSAE